MSDSAVAYCAGVIDSDGCIRIGRRRHGERWYYVASITVGQVTREAVDFLAETFGGGIYLDRSRNSGRRSMYRWQVSNRTATAALGELVGHLKIKKAQAENCLALDLVRASSPLTRRGIAKGKPLITESTSEAMRVLFDRSKELNRVGAIRDDSEAVTAPE